MLLIANDIRLQTGNIVEKNRGWLVDSRKEVRLTTDNGIMANDVHEVRS
jgi:hypothetical protein